MSTEDSPTGEDTEALALLQAPSVSMNGSGCKSGTWSSDGASTPSIKFSAFETALNPPAKNAVSDCAITLRTEQRASDATGITSFKIAGEGAIPSGTKADLDVSVYALGDTIRYSNRFTFNGNFYGSWEKSIFIPDDQVSYGCGTANLFVRLHVRTSSESGNGIGSLVVREIKRVGSRVSACGN